MCCACEIQIWREIEDIADLNWLLIEERVDFALVKLVFNGLNNKNIPENLQLKLSKEKLYGKIQLC